MTHLKADSELVIHLFVPAWNLLEIGEAWRSD